MTNSEYAWKFWLWQKYTKQRKECEMINCELRIAILRKLIYELRVTFYEL